MGIKTLLPFLKDVTENSYLDSFKGLVAAVDASCWLHKAIAISYSQFGDDRRVKEICNSYLDLLERNKIRPLVVLNGLPLPGKDRERDNRAIKKLTNFGKSGKVTEARNALAAAAEINHDLVCGFIQTCRQKSIDYVVAPYEADAEMALLYEHGYYIAISEDSDLLAYGCQKVLFKLRLDGVCEVIELGKVLQHLSLTQEEFLDMCIVAGCDYLENVRGIGIHTAHKLVTKEKTDFLAVLQRKSICPSDYSSGFQRAKAIFRHQTVINPINAETMPLTPWGQTPDKEAFLNPCGILLSNEYAVNLAVGNVDPRRAQLSGIPLHFPSRRVCGSLETWH
ncbi:unnamed protein product [Porites lobata]|uniref:Exonuclease 1 n=1 Tax=Porites lobata TaxID=104759 RepID=A0ABN8NQM8_9CNID|nr:unnamed protein product [Porites lobata]